MSTFVEYFICLSVFDVTVDSCKKNNTKKM